MRGKHMHARGKKSAEEKPGSEFGRFAGRLTPSEILEVKELTRLHSIPDTDERVITDVAITSPSSRARVRATEMVVDPANMRKILDGSPHTDSKELARCKLRGLGYDV
ncbi:hypothetical protein H0O02_01200 [Candidatus Micrarchaeota archaeon]|nr:hypothetical protein [Candidatus Micrarchaeota archaeon]